MLLKISIPGLPFIQTCKFLTEKHFFHSPRLQPWSHPATLLANNEQLVTGPERTVGRAMPLPATGNTTMPHHSYVLKMGFLKPLDYLERISHEFYDILTLLPSAEFHCKLPVRAKDSHKQTLWSVSQKGKHM